MMFPFHISVADCSCSEIVDRKGHGKCLKRNKLHNGAFNCIVNLPSFCLDLVQDELNLEIFWSADACEDKNEGILIIIKYK